MGNFVVKSQTSNVNYEYSDTTVIVQGSYAKETTTDTLQSLNGNCYRKNEQGQQGEFFGSFNGYMRDGVVKYNMSEMTRRDSNTVWDAIDEIEPHVLGTNSEE